MIQNDHYQKNWENRKALFIWYGWITGSIVWVFVALYTALFPPGIPNSSLISYGFASVCLWQMLVYLDYHIVHSELSVPALLSGTRASPFAKNSRCLNGIYLIILSCIFLYVGCVSAVATFALFPHPNVLGRFHHNVLGKFSFDMIPLYLPILVYIPALAAIYRLSIRGYCIVKGSYYSKLLDLAENQKRRDILLSQWLADIHKNAMYALSKEEILPHLKDDKNSKIFPIPSHTFFMRRVFSFWTLVILILVWILGGIPLKHYSSLSSTPLPSLVIMGITSLGITGWLFIIIFSYNYVYQINKDGLIQKGIWGEKGIVWFQLATVCFYEGILVLKDVHGKSHSIYMKDVQKPYEFWGNLLSYLPLSILLVSESGWKYLKKISSQDEFTDFVDKYRKVWNISEAEKIPKKKKKSKKH